jgi:ATP-dependent protease HslVU (ClpYQ) peptidase subunit
VATGIQLRAPDWEYYARAAEPPGEPMTLIAMWRRSDHVLVASDTLATAATPGLSKPATKVWQMGSSPLMWGYAGPSVYGRTIEARMNGPLPPTWEDLIETVGSWVSEANALARRHAQQAGLSDAPPGSLLHVVVGGVWNGQADVIEIEPSGMRARSDADQTYIGSAAQAAELANTIATRFEAPSFDQLRVVMESTVRFRLLAQDVGEPIQYWRITAEGVEELK